MSRRLGQMSQKWAKREVSLRVPNAAQLQSRTIQVWLRLHAIRQQKLAACQMPRSAPNSTTLDAYLLCALNCGRACRGARRAVLFNQRPNRSPSRVKPGLGMQSMRFVSSWYRGPWNAVCQNMVEQHTHQSRSTRVQDMTDCAAQHTKRCPLTAPVTYKYG